MTEQDTFTAGWSASDSTADHHRYDVQRCPNRGPRCERLIATTNEEEKKMQMSRRVVAEFIGRAIGWYRQGEPASFIASVLGAILILMLYRSLTGDRRSGPFARVS